MATIQKLKSGIIGMNEAASDLSEQIMYKGLSGASAKFWVVSEAARTLKIRV